MCSPHSSFLLNFIEPAQIRSANVRITPKKNWCWNFNTNNSDQGSYETTSYRWLIYPQGFYGRGGGISFPRGSTTSVGGGISFPRGATSGAGGGISSPRGSKTGAGHGISSPRGSTTGTSGGISSPRGATTDAGGSLSSPKDSLTGAGGCTFDSLLTSA